MRAFAVIALMGLAGCVSPLDACVSRADQDLAGLSAAIETARLNVARGYAVNTQTVPTTGLTLCTGSTFGGKSTVVGATWCNQTEYRTVQTPLPLDIEAEEDKLAQMQERLPAARERRNREVAACYNQFEG